MVKKEKEVFGEEIQKIIENINKQYGEGVITTLEKSEIKENKFLSTGSFHLDQAIGGGYGLGRIIEIYGQEGSGKTTLALHAVNECQKKGETVAYIDIENALDFNYTKKLGVESSKLLILYPENGEKAFELVIKLIEQGVNLIIIDSVAALVPKAELEADLEKQSIGLQARMMSVGLRNINHSLVNKKCTIIFINQIRNKISTGFFAGNPETTTGGRALSYFASLRIKLKAKERIERNNEYVGIKVQATVIKNRFASPYKEVFLEVIFGQGIKKNREILDSAVEKEIIQKSGNWYSYQDQKIGNGREVAVDYLEKNPLICQEIEQKILEELSQKS